MTDAPRNLMNHTPEQFWSRVAIKGQNECWEWTGSRTGSNGYGHLNWMGKSNCAHRIALSLTDGDWDSRLFVLHRCDNPPCCNPAHLWRGTQSENLRDMVAKGRQSMKASVVRRCSVEGCDRPVEAYGFCTNHWYRLKKHGSPTAGRPFGIIKCTVEGCDKPYLARGYCNAHYKRWQQHRNVSHDFA